MNLAKVKTFISDDHANLEGWFYPLDQLAFFELFLLQDSLGIRGNVAEVGVYCGKSLVLLSILRQPGDILLGFDLFDENHEEKTRANLKQYGDSQNVLLHKGLTSDLEQGALAELSQSGLRFLHIDAGHEYHEVLEQLHLFTPLMADSGIIAMDDYQDREFPGIEAAVLDFSEIDRPRRFIPFLSAANKLFMCFGPVATTFQKALLSRPNFMDSSRLTRVRDFNVLIMRSKLPVPSDDILAQLDSLAFPRRAEDELSLSQKALRFSQLTFGSGA